MTDHRYDSTTHPAKRSFVEVHADHPFPIQNLPYGVCQRADRPVPSCCVALGEFVVDLKELEAAGLLPNDSGPLFEGPTLNTFAACGKTTWRRVRETLSQLLDRDEPQLRDDAALRSRAIVSAADIQMRMPMTIGDYTDFYSSREHATNVGTMFRGKDNALQPNWLHLPVAYHGRASSVVVSDTAIRRPCGQTMPEGAERPVFGPSKALDFELEMGFFIGPGNPLQQPIPVQQAEDHIFGLALVNDWSARDIQRWEYVPLGPFLAKNFATSISPWIVSLDALQPFRCAGPQQDPPPLDYLRIDGPQTFDVQLIVKLATSELPEADVICRSNFRYLYWNMSQQLAHHTVTGCNMRTGDLLASGTISGSTPDSYGSMLELAWKGTRPLTLASGESRSMIADGDTVIMSAYAQGDGYRVGFGEVRGTIEPADGS